MEYKEDEWIERIEEAAHEAIKACDILGEAIKEVKWTDYQDYSTTLTK